MSEDDDTERTEDASPERRKRARDDGQFPRSKDSGPVAASIAALGVIGAMAGDFAGTIRGFCLRCFDDPLSLVRGDISLLAEQAGLVLVSSSLPVAVAAAIAGTAVGFLEAGFHPNFDLLEVKLERLDPISKLGTMFSPKSGLMSVVMSLLRVVVVAVVAESVMEKAFPKLARLSRAPLGAAVWETAQVVMSVALWSTLALGLIAALDYGWSWWRHEQSIKMSRQELKDEHKQQEGSPQIRARQRARAREMLKRGIRKGVKEATVIVANPTHVAVALRYRQHEGAPTVTTKGYDEIALQIKKLAKEEGIPIIENRPLARALAERVRVGRVIPADLYVAVAELLAMVYRLKNRGIRA
ncbi:MAG TPA: EscU/YscU/HrcU family type III secretion system export apparatus switch protein [Polyangiaceae bacterium]|jgi:flagellar biosynthesis protein FlhB|nr:EscU/YscU/HrcU family type III secretion system export apparatus switch protein [Polyangiaceae bacterium]